MTSQTTEAIVRVSSIRILLVDDVESWRLSVTSMLRAEPSLEVIFEASDGLKAVQAAESLQPAVVLLDIGLPGLKRNTGGWMGLGLLVLQADEFCDGSFKFAHAVVGTPLDLPLR